MNQEEKKNTWDEIRKTGLFAFLLALPVMIWRSSKFGRTLAWITISMFIFWFAGRLSDVVFTKFINRWEIRHESDKVLRSISEIQKSLDSVAGDVSGINSHVKRKSSERVNQIVSEYREKITGLDKQIGELEKSIDAFRSDERAAVKERIVALRETVLIGKQSTDSKTIRMEFEDLIKNMNLLTAEEKERFNKDLKDMGFYVEKVGEQVRAYRDGNVFTSRDVVMVGVTPYRRRYPQYSASMDSTIVYGNYEEQ